MEASDLHCRFSLNQALTLGDIDVEEALFLALDGEPDLGGGGIDEGEATGDLLLDTAVAKLDALARHALQNGLART